jgi:hypothetical protein
MAYEYAPWPAWASGPKGESAIFQSEDEVPAGWEHHGKVKGGKPQLDHDKDGKAGGSKAAEETVDLPALRAAYKEKFGKKPFGGWDAETLREKLAR